MIVLARGWVMPYWMAIPLLVIEFVLFYLVFRRGFVRGKRERQFKWRCPNCQSIMFCDDPEELLQASLVHMKKHLEVQNGAVPPPEEGCR